eukprot:312747-Rhodomonas_salina.2
MALADHAQAELKLPWYAHTGYPVPGYPARVGTYPPAARIPAVPLPVPPRSWTRAILQSHETGRFNSASSGYASGTPGTRIHCMPTHSFFSSFWPGGVWIYFAHFTVYEHYCKSLQVLYQLALDGDREASVL